MRRYGQFTPARRAALHRAAIISAAKRRGRKNSPQISMNGHQGKSGFTNKPIVRKTAKAAVVGTGVGLVTYGAYRVNHVTLYHNTSPKYAQNIVKKQRFGSGEPRGKQSATFFAKGRNDTKHFGTATVKVRMRKNVYHKMARTDHAEGGRAVYIHTKRLNASGVKFKYQKSRHFQDRAAHVYDRTNMRKNMRYAKHPVRMQKMRKARKVRVAQMRSQVKANGGRRNFTVSGY